MRYLFLKLQVSFYFIFCFHEFKEEWSAGSEIKWSLMGFLEECFCALVLNIAPGGLTHSGQESMSGDSAHPPLSQKPREVLSSVDGVSVDDIINLENQLIGAQVRCVGVIAL